jgi:hypothetical protein
MASEVLTGVVAFVSINNDGGLNASAAFSKQLASAGAKIAPRLCKEVTHVVFKGPDDELRAMYDRVHKVRSSPHGALHMAFARLFPLLIRSGRPEHRTGRSHSSHRPASGVRVRLRSCHPTPCNIVIVG